jgi:hypothetical protein
MASLSRAFVLLICFGFHSCCVSDGLLVCSYLDTGGGTIVLLVTFLGLATFLGCVTCCLTPDLPLEASLRIPISDFRTPLLLVFGVPPELSFSNKWLQVCRDPLKPMPSILLINVYS